jgi:hypothetical protein
MSAWSPPVLNILDNESYTKIVNHLISLGHPFDVNAQTFDGARHQISAPMKLNGEDSEDALQGLAQCISDTLDSGSYKLNMLQITKANHPTEALVTALFYC